MAPSELLGALSTAVADGDLFSSGPDEGDTGKKPPRPPVYVSFQPCPICLEAFTPVPEGLLRVPAKEWMEAIRNGAQVFDLTGHFFCDCEGTRHRRDRCPNWKPTEAGLPKGRYIPAAWLRTMEARDGHVCGVAGCEHDGPLHAGHLRPHRDGHPPIPENMRQQCAGCNQLIENGAIRVVGQAPYDRDGNLLGYGYRRGIRSAGPEKSHVGNSATEPASGAGGAEKVPKRPPGGPEAA